MFSLVGFWITFVICVASLSVVERREGGGEGGRGGGHTMLAGPDAWLTAHRRHQLSNPSQCQ